jgi:hypothetical protein
MASAPGFFVELDQALEFAQDMGVAEGVVDRVEPAITSIALCDRRH